MFFFFFKQKTAYEMRISDWSSDVCSSDLVAPARSDQQSGHRCNRNEQQRPGITGQADGDRVVPVKRSVDLGLHPRKMDPGCPRVEKLSRPKTKSTWNLYATRSLDKTMSTPATASPATGAAPVPAPEPASRETPRKDSLAQIGRAPV